MRTAAYKVDVESDRRRRENVPRHILCYAGSAKKSGRKKEPSLLGKLFSGIRKALQVVKNAALHIL